MRTKAKTIRFRSLFFGASVIVAMVFIRVPLSADEPGWVTRVIKSPSERAASQATPIVERPYRPLHFYGNTVRRQYYRQSPLPLPRDFVESTRGLIPPIPSIPPALRK